MNFFTEGPQSVRDELMGRLMQHVGRSPESVRRAMWLMGGRTADDFDDRRLALLLGYLDQPVPPRDAR